MYYDNRRSRTGTTWLIFELDDKDRPGSADCTY